MIVNSFVLVMLVTATPRVFLAVDRLGMSKTVHFNGMHSRLEC